MPALMPMPGGLVFAATTGPEGGGGGFLVVPALVLVTGMGIQRAVATSLLVNALVGGSGVASYAVAGRPLPMDLSGLFVLGEIAGMELGTLIGRRLGGPRLKFRGSSSFTASPWRKILTSAKRQRGIHRSGEGHGRRPRWRIGLVPSGRRGHANGEG